MKKLILAFAVVAMAGAFSSCSKTCTCKTYAGGQLVRTDEDVELSGSAKKCSDLSQISLANPKTGIECE
ncbi:MAG: hypothetical protein J6X88_02615 [Bacteroidales bacterium]|nr:hypothetical protein [Bacteroidales bacterium]